MVGQRRWYAWPEGLARTLGPFRAAELAYRIHTGRVGPRDLVVDGRTGERYVVGENGALARWRDRGATGRARLFRLAVREARARARVEGLGGRSCLASWALELLDEEQRSAFEVLGLEPTSSGPELARRYRALALAHHPDRGGEAERMREVNRAFAALRGLWPCRGAEPAGPRIRREKVLDTDDPLWHGSAASPARVPMRKGRAGASSSRERAKAGGSGA